MITPEQYISKPHVDEEIKRQHFSGTELLKRGTKVLYNSYKMSPSLLTKQKKENESCSLTTTGNPGNTRRSNSVIVMDEKCEKAGLLPVENTRYAMEGPLTTKQSYTK
ncbi:hypothetical protein OS493_026099 [Desmophyllum pertusum]|uniref:Uncharacterized protein n=1 Tax=Desmophyllum pertusum TaxID=174260 RepID=A0A9X0CDR3_9CNID|nr:hypothetical protein OS493_026099 [Desmophyllum pertusum]